MYKFFQPINDIKISKKNYICLLLFIELCFAILTYIDVFTRNNPNGNYQEDFLSSCMSHPSDKNIAEALQVGCLESCLRKT